MGLARVTPQGQPTVLVAQAVPVAWHGLRGKELVFLHRTVGPVQLMAPLPKAQVTACFQRDPICSHPA